MFFAIFHKPEWFKEAAGTPIDQVNKIINIDDSMVNKIKCPFCNELNEIDYKFCLNCGKELPIGDDKFNLDIDMYQPLFLYSTFPFDFLWQ